MTDARTGAGNMKDDPGEFCFVFFLILFLVGGKLFYNIMLVSALQLYIHTHTYIYTHNTYIHNIDTHIHTPIQHTHTHIYI